MTDFLRAPWSWPRSVSSKLIEGPLHEPLTLTQGKLRAGLDWPEGDPRDDLMLGFIAAARQKVEQDTGLALIKQTRLVHLTAIAGSILPLPSQALPLLAITDDSGAPVSVVWERGTLAAPTAILKHFAEPLDGPPVAMLREDWGLSFVEDFTGTWRITAGWPDRSTLAKEAPLLYHAVGLLTAHYATLGRDLASVDESFAVPLGYDDAIAPFRLMWLA